MTIEIKDLPSAPASKPQPEPGVLYQIQDAPELGDGVKVVKIGNKYFLHKGADLLAVDSYDDGIIIIKDTGIEFAPKRY